MELRSETARGGERARGFMLIRHIWAWTFKKIEVRHHRSSVVMGVPRSFPKVLVALGDFPIRSCKIKVEASTEWIVLW